MKKICPNCGNDNVEEALFCIKCGTKLVSDEDPPTAKIDVTRIIQAPEAPPPPPSIPEVGSQVGLYMMTARRVLPLLGKEEFTIGRGSEGTSSIPDVDLNPYEAYSQGVSRIHAAIKIHKEGVYISDLGSSNGTSINNVKINPHKDHRLSHGDVITLGIFRVQALIHKGRGI